MVTAGRLEAAQGAHPGRDLLGVPPDRLGPLAARALPGLGRRVRPPATGRPRSSRANGTQDVRSEIGRALGVTLQLVIFSEVIALLLGMASARWGRLRQYSFFDYAATGAAFFMFSMPLFCVAVILQVRRHPAEQLAGEHRPRPLDRHLGATPGRVFRRPRATSSTPTPGRSSCRCCRWWPSSSRSTAASSGPPCWSTKADPRSR